MRSDTTWPSAQGVAKIAAALERAERERMSAEVRVFIAAIEHDFIDAGDFASGRAPLDHAALVRLAR